MFLGKKGVILNSEKMLLISTALWYVVQEEMELRRKEYAETKIIFENKRNNYNRSAGICNGTGAISQSTIMDLVLLFDHSWKH